MSDADVLTEQVLVTSDLQPPAGGESNEKDALLQKVPSNLDHLTVFSNLILVDCCAQGSTSRSKGGGRQCSAK